MDSHQEYDEAQMIRLIQVGSPEEANEAFRQLYEYNDSSLRSFLVYSKGLQEFEIDEVCATVWDRALDRIARYVPKGIPYLVWLKRTAGYVIHERYRFQKQQNSHTVPILEDFDIEGDMTWMHPLLSLLEAEDEKEAVQRRQEIGEALERLVEQLPPNYRDVIEARHEMELSPKDAAELLGWEPRKISDTYYRANKRLERLLLKEYGITKITGWLAE